MALPRKEGLARFAPRHFDAFMSLLDPDAALRANDAAVPAGAEEVVRGSANLARTYSGGWGTEGPALASGAAEPYGGGRGSS